MGASRCRNAAGLYYFKRLRRTDWLLIGDGDSDEQEERGSASDADSDDPYDGWCGDQSDCSSLRSRSEGYPSSDGYVSDHEIESETGEHIEKDQPESFDEHVTGCADLFEEQHDAKRRNLAE